MAVSICLLFSGAVPAQSGVDNTGAPGMRDARVSAGDSALLTEQQKAAVLSILSKYNAATLTTDDAKAIHRAFRDAGVRGGPGLREAITSAGFDPHKLRDLDPPPDRKGREEAGSVGNGHGRKGGGKGARDVSLPVPEGVWPVASVIVARPGATTVDVNVLALKNIRGHIEYWGKGTAAVSKTKEQEFKTGEPLVVHLSNLKGNTSYSYRLVYAESGQSAMTAGPDYAFHTQRPAGSAFVFEIQGDSHPERPHQNDPALYSQTLCAAAKDQPDFYLTMGDDFSVDTLREINAAAVEKIYLGQRQYLGLVGHSAPLFLVNGNHEQAALCNLDGTPNNVAVWAQNSREKYFSQPAPEGIYTGNSEPVEHIGLLRNYYSWTWGDALFVVIDPYWHSGAPVDNVFGGGKKARDLWQITLGESQYRWLRQTLEQSTAKFKFVFAHHVNGTTRGGIEQADYYEWGGRDHDGSWAFDAKRHGWGLPIHQLLAKTGVTIFFQGHDHIFAKQEKDGVIYQTVPVPAGPADALDNRQAYRSGDVLPGSGRMRVTVSSDKVSVEFVRSYVPKQSSAEHPDGEIAYAYSIAPRQASPKNGTP